MPPPAKVFADALVRLIVAVLALIVPFPDAWLHAVPDPVIVHVPVPRLITLAFAFAVLKLPSVTLKLFALNVAAAAILKFPVAVSESWSVRVAELLTPMTVFIEAPFVVIVKEPGDAPLKNRPPELLIDVVETIDRFPQTLMLFVLENVTVPALTVKFRHETEAPTVTVYVVALSKIALSALVGIDAPDAPPLEADQFVVEARFHVPDPPTQYLLAIRSPMPAGSLQLHPKTLRSCCRCSQRRWFY
jgi:hypothetical protein